MTVPKGVPGAVPGRRLARASTQKKLDELLMRAASLIARKGFEATSMRDLAKAIDSSLAGLYHYFSSKEDLLFQLQYRTFAVAARVAGGGRRRGRALRRSASRG